MALDGRLAPPAIVLTGHQLAGRGRGKNSWWSGPGCITATAVLDAQPDLPVNLLPLRMGLAIRNALAHLAQSDAVQVKWPNDLIADKKKLAGILCERRGNLDFIGCGVNVNLENPDLPTDLRQRITFLSTIAGHPLDLNDAFLAVCKAIHQEAERTCPAPQFHEEYNRVHVLPGRRVTVVQNENKSPIQGNCIGIDHQGRLLINTGRDTVALHTGTVTQ
jgi:BirA family biotin operon repressor/biotin-[acetyl-CoA-carboxylase] ligase